MKSAQYITHLMATTANGIEVVTDLLDYPEMELMSFRDFESELSSLSDGEVIFTAVEPDELEELKQNYSVN